MKLSSPDLYRVLCAVALEGGVAACDAPSDDELRDDAPSPPRAPKGKRRGRRRRSAAAHDHRPH